MRRGPGAVLRDSRNDCAACSKRVDADDLDLEANAAGSWRRDRQRDDV